MCKAHYNWNDFQVLQPGFEASEYIFQQEPVHDPLVNQVQEPEHIPIAPPPHAEAESSSSRAAELSISSPDRSAYYFASPPSSVCLSGSAIRNRIESTPASPWVSDNERIHHPSGQTYI